MKPSRYAFSRQKACQQCSDAKAKCDRKSGGCGRCIHRRLCCTYPHAVPPRHPVPNMSIDGDEELSSTLSPSNNLPAPDSLLSTIYRGLLADGDTHSQIVESGQSVNGSIPAGSHSTILTDARFTSNSNLDATSCPSKVSEIPESFDFPAVELVCPINADDISNRWLNAYIPVSGQKIKEYPTGVSSFIYRILNSYAAIAIHNRGIPPFVHPLQMMAVKTSLPLSTCFSLVRICQKPLRGSEGVATDVLQREMSNLYELRGIYDDINLLAAFQAYLIYAMVLYFQLSQGSNPFLRQAMMNLQELACASSRRGLVCLAEQQHFRPRWEAWIVAEAKRRTLYTMYLFDSVLSTQDGLPTFFGTELQGLPAPADKLQWQARSRHDWEKLYTIYLAEWMDGGLRIDELWPIPADLNASDIVERRSRVDKWLENVDEYGTMLFTVTHCTHGG